MLVDLGRNDLGRVCEYNTVKVPELLVTETYSHVIHIVSQVEGKLREGLDGFDLLRATFPAGTLSGAPKGPCYGDHRRVGRCSTRTLWWCGGIFWF